MKRIYILTAAAVLLCSCTPKQHRLIAPLPSGIDTENMQDCTVPAVFTSDDFLWDEGKLNMVVYADLTRRIRSILYVQTRRLTLRVSRTAAEGSSCSTPASLSKTEC